MITLKNKRATLECRELGGEMRRLTADGKDVLWNGDAAFWAGIAPVIFPVCGGFLTEEYTYNGETYRMPKHGFGRFYEFETEASGEDFVTFLLRANEDTLKQYPFRFELRTTYRLTEDAVTITQDVRNADQKVMPFAIGSHEGYATPEGIEEYDVVFARPETLKACTVQGNLLTHETTTVLENGTVLPLEERYFATEALVFKGIHSRAVTLRHRTNGREITVEFPGKEHFLIWHPQGAPFICLEPWTGFPSYIDQPQDLATKEGMFHLQPNETYTVSHTIRF